jgi:hypothetical protein
MNDGFLIIDRDKGAGWYDKAKTFLEQQNRNELIPQKSGVTQEESKAAFATAIAAVHIMSSGHIEIKDTADIFIASLYKHTGIAPLECKCGGNTQSCGGGGGSCPPPPKEQ